MLDRHLSRSPLTVSMYLCMVPPSMVQPVLRIFGSSCQLVIGALEKVARLQAYEIWYTLKETILWKQSFFCCQKVNACIHGQSAHKNTSGHLSFQSCSPQFHPLWWLLGPLLLGWLSWSKGCRKGQKCSS